MWKHARRPGGQENGSHVGGRKGSGFAPKLPGAIGGAGRLEGSQQTDEERYCLESRMDLLFERGNLAIAVVRHPQIPVGRGLVNHSRRSQDADNHRIWLGEKSESEWDRALSEHEDMKERFAKAAPLGVFNSTTAMTRPIRQPRKPPCRKDPETEHSPREVVGPAAFLWRIHGICIPGRATFRPDSHVTGTFTEESFRRQAHLASTLARVSGEAQHCPSTQIAEPVRPGPPWPESFAEVGRPRLADFTANRSI